MKRPPADRGERASRLVADFRDGRRPALARAISIVERGGPAAMGVLADLLLAEPQARRFGITGPPGAGKSSLIRALATLLRARGEEVAIIAVDPTSPFSGGALLGDRIRMNDMATDPGVFIRSMATRGSLGGLAASTREAIDLLDAFGFPNILVETVGVGQTELEIASTADSVAVVLVPESGDGVQAMKAGLMEIADLFVVNKSDRVGADRMVRAIRQALLLRAGHAGRDLPAHHGVDLKRVPGEPDEGSAARRPHAAAPPTWSGWSIPVIKTSAGRDEGVDAMLERLLDHRRYLESSGELELRRRTRARQRIQEVVERRLARRAREHLAARPELEQWVADVAAGRSTAYGVAQEVARAIAWDGGLRATLDEGRGR